MIATLTLPSGRTIGLAPEHLAALKTACVELLQDDAERLSAHGRGIAPLADPQPTRDRMALISSMLDHFGNWK